MYLHMQERNEKMETQKAQFFAAIVMQGVLDWCSVIPSSFWELALPLLQISSSADTPN